MNVHVSIKSGVLPFWTKRYRRLLFKSLACYSSEASHQENFTLLNNKILKRFKHTSLTTMDERLVWADLEMTGLNVETDRIMEAAFIVTDSDLNILKEGPNLVIKVDDAILDNMNSWCKQHHGESGLTEACRKSSVTLEMAEDQILQFVTQYTKQGKAPLAGNSIHADKKFLDKYMPKLMKHLHYRIVDVSTIKELCRRWYPEDYASAPVKKIAHRAVDDIRESIQELKYYKNTIFK